MTDFDTRLRARLEGLDAAVPTPRPPGPIAEDRSLATIPRRQFRLSGRRRLAVLLAAAALVVVASAVTAGGLFVEDEHDPHPDVTAALEEVFNVELADDGCVTAAEATGPIRARLDAMGHADWAIEARPGTEDPHCVAAAIFDAGQVGLLPAAGGDVSSALEVLSDELMSRCLGREDATALVSSTLTGLGVTDFSVHAQAGGMYAVSAGQEEAVRDHIAAGCYVYAYLGWDEQGHPTYYLAGP